MEQRFQQQSFVPAVRYYSRCYSYTAQYLLNFTTLLKKSSFPHPILRYDVSRADFEREVSGQLGVQAVERREGPRSQDDASGHFQPFEDYSGVHTHEAEL